MQNLAKALLAAQATMPDAVKDSTNPHFHSKYASYESVRDAVNPHLAAQGLLVLQTFEPSVPADAGPIIVTTLLHISGEQIQSRLFLPASKKDALGFGSCITYGRRYSLQSICGIGGEEDDDGNGASGRPAPVQRNAPPAQQASKPVPPPTPAAQATAPANPVTGGRREVGEKLMKCAKDDKARYQGFLSCMIPGKTSVANLNDNEVEICKLILTAAVDIQNETDVIQTKAALQTTLKANTPVHMWTPQHIAAAYAAVRGQSPTNSIPPEHSAANVKPEDCPF